MNGQLVYGLFKSRASAADAIDDLKAAKFSMSDLKVLSSEPSPLDDETVFDKRLDSTTRGVISGITGALIGFGVGIYSGKQVLPGLSSMTIAAPILTALLGIGVGGALGALFSYFFDLQTARAKTKVSRRFKSGGFLIFADTSDARLASLAQAILKKNHAQQISVSPV